MKQKKQTAASPSTPPRRRSLEIAVSAALVAVLVLLAIYFQASEADREATAARKRMFVPAKVTQVISDNGEPDTWTEGRRIGEQVIEVEILSGDYKGARLTTANYMNAYVNVDCQPGTRIIVRLDLDGGEPYIVSIPNYDRGRVLIPLVLVFALLLVLIGGKKGVMALAGLAYTLACLWFVLVPAILRGMPPVLVSCAVVALTTAATLIFLNGFSRKTLCATLGCICGVVSAGLFAGLASLLTPINGFNMSEAEELVLRAYDSGLYISGLLVSGILIASLGAVMDVAMSIASACEELRVVNPGLTKTQLFRSGMNIGRDAMGTMANTLILAFAGASLNMLVLFQVYDYPMIQLLNIDAMAIELIRGIAGSVGIILTVPFVAAFSAAKK